MIFADFSPEHQPTVTESARLALWPGDRKQFPRGGTCRVAGVSNGARRLRRAAFASDGLRSSTGLTRRLCRRSTAFVRLMVTNLAALAVRDLAPVGVALTRRLRLGLPVSDTARCAGALASSEAQVHEDEEQLCKVSVHPLPSFVLNVVISAVLIPCLLTERKSLHPRKKCSSSKYYRSEP